ncbi:MAG: universal stress protein [Pirellulaceae bacterium]
MYGDSARAILHPTDFSEASQLAFAHALAVAVANQANLTIMHVTSDPENVVPWHEFPSVRKTLESWGYLEPGSARHDVSKKLGVRVQKTVGVGDNVVTGILKFLEVNLIDMIVLATEEEAGVPGWLRTQVAVPVAEKSHKPTLFVRSGAKRSSIDPRTGDSSLNHVLVPVDHQPDSAPVMNRVMQAMHQFGGNDANVTLLYVGPEERFPQIDLPNKGNFKWIRRSVDSGNPAKAIVDIADEIAADLIAMVTEGRQGLLDVLRGSTSQQVLRRAPCPLFTLPAAHVGRN